MTFKYTLNVLPLSHYESLAQRRLADAEPAQHGSTAKSRASAQDLQWNDTLRETIGLAIRAAGTGAVLVVPRGYGAQVAQVLALLETVYPRVRYSKIPIEECEQPRQESVPADRAVALGATSSSKS